MKPTRTIPFVLALSLLPAAPLQAQEAGEEPMPELQDQVEKRLPVYVEAPLGKRAAVKNEQGQTLGVFKDHVIDRKTGHVTHVAVGGVEVKDEKSEARLVPYDRFQWDKKSRQLLLPMTAEELRKMPAYDAERQLRKAGKQADGALEKSQGGETKADDAARKHREAMTEGESTSITATHLVGTAIYAGEQEFAATSGLLLQPKTGEIAFVLAQGKSAQDDPYIMPWGALTLQKAPDAQPLVAETDAAPAAAHRFVLDAAPEELRSAPKLKGGDPESLRSRDAIAEIFEFYGLEAPRIRVAEAGMNG